MGFSSTIACDGDQLDSLIRRLNVRDRESATVQADDKVQEYTADVHASPANDNVQEYTDLH